jgi:hypothetical protein
MHAAGAPWAFFLFVGTATAITEVAKVKEAVMGVESKKKM